MHELWRTPCQSIQVRGRIAVNAKGLRFNTLNNCILSTNTAPIAWKRAILAAISRYASRHRTVLIERKRFLTEELLEIVKETRSRGATPWQTASRVLQELRDEGFLYFSKSGVYALNHSAVDVTSEDIPLDVLENASVQENLQLVELQTTTEIGTSRLRRGMQALRAANLRNYQNLCVLCDIDDDSLLVTSHVARWADRPEARGYLSNVICMCRMHDTLFENGYFAFSDSMQVLWRPSITSHAINLWRERCTRKFRLPELKAPNVCYLQEHRMRVGL